MSEEGKLRELVWKVAGRPETGLDWVLDSKEDFTLGKIERDERGYFIPVSDAHLDRQTHVYIPENDLREGDFAEEMREANTSYEQRLSQERWREQRRKEGFRRKTKTALITTTVLGLLALGGKLAYNYHNSPEKVAERKRISELDEKARFIIPSNTNPSRWILSANPEEYTLTNKDQVSVYIAHEGSNRRLYISKNGKNGLFQKNGKSTQMEMLEN